jgi:hypothetical protein
MSMTSMTLRRRDALPGGGPERWAGVPLAGGLAFQAIEGLLTSAGAHLGEELVLVATSPAS